MKILFVNPPGQLGGAELSLLDLMASLQALDPALELQLVTGARGPLADRAEAQGITVHARPMPEEFAQLGDSSLRTLGKLGRAMTLARRGLPAALAGRRYAGELRRLIREIRPDLIHSNSMKGHLLLRLARIKGVPVVWHLRDFVGSRPMMSRLLRWSSKSAVGAIAISEAVGLDAHLTLRGLPVRVVHNAIDVARFTPGPGDGARLDVLAGLDTAPDETVRVGLVATYARWKGQDLFLRALATLPRELPVRFYIIGGPIYETRGSQFSEAELRALAESEKIADRVAFVPFQKETADIYRALDVVVHASTLPEPFGRTIVEAMACGRPVVVSRAGGAAELFDEGVSAVGFVPLDPVSLASAIEGLVRNPARRQSLSTEARRSAESRFSRDRLGRDVLAAYAAFSDGVSP